MKNKKIFALATLATFIAVSSFVIANSAPTVRVLFPNGGETLSGDVNILWYATDPDNDPLRINISYWKFGTGMPVSITEDTENDGNYLWDTTGLCGAYKIGITAFDGKLAGTDWSDNYFNITTSCEYPIPKCEGNVQLKLSPNPVNAGQRVNAYVYGLTSACERKVARIKLGSPYNGQMVAKCWITRSGDCRAYFNAPTFPGTYPYFALVDKNNDGRYEYREGEIGMDVLRVFGWIWPGSWWSGSWFNR